MAKAKTDKKEINIIDKNKNILVLVESPAKVKKVGEIFKKLGYTKAKVAATIGHTTFIKDDYKSYKNTGIYPDQNFKIQWAIAEDKVKVVENIKQQAKTAELVLIASDPDREGESLGNHIKNILNLKDTQYYRIKYHSLTVEDIQTAIENASKMDEDLCEAAEARQVLDKLIGYSLSPIAKTYVGAKSVGRVQSVGLKLVVDREHEIQTFKPETYFDLYLNFEKKGTKFKAKFAGNPTIGNIDHLKTQAEVNKVKKNCTGDYTIEDIKKREKEESPKPPFCTATFQQEAASKLNLKVKDAMSVAQKLFEAGRITYHRTDDTSFAAEFLLTLKSYIEGVYGKTAYTKPRVGKKQENGQEGHECLRVTDPSITPEIFNNMDTNSFNQRVYKLIWQRTIAAAMPNAKISETQYLINNNDEKFILVSNEVTNLGYREIYAYKDEDAEEDGPVKETFKMGEKLSKCKLEDVKKETKPAPRFTEATLIKELQKRGLGRPSTYASIVETVLSPTRGYAELDGKSIVPSEKGIQLAGFLDRSFSNIINLEYTSDMEKELDLIASGKKKKLDFLTEFYNTLETTVKNSPEVAGSLAANAEEKLCPLCGKTLVVRRSRFGKLFYGCDYPRCRYTENIK